MAEALAFDLLKSLLEKLLCAAVNEVRSAAETESQMKSLADTKAMIEAVLPDQHMPVERQDGSRIPQQELERLSSALDKIDDLIDENAARSKMNEIAGLRDRVRLFFSADSNPALSFCRDIRRVKEIRKELDTIAKDLGLLGSILSPMFRTIKEQAQAHALNRDMGSDVIMEEVIGRDRDRDIIREMLLNSRDSSSFSVIAIVGIGGLGKTTLAQCVYNDERVQKHFDKPLWVSASRDFNAQEILEKIIESATHASRPCNLGMAELQHQARDAIERKKYLLVLDDIWDVDDKEGSHTESIKLRTEWEKLRTTLLHGGAGSKILITTRDERAAKRVDSTYIHKLEDLGEEDSWHLFRRAAFSPEGPIEPDLEEIGREILKRCSKVPLVIRSIGGLLKEQEPTKDRWKAFRDNSLKNLSAQADVLQSLKLSYDQLHPRLKLCFAYCSLFPRGWRIDKDDLIRLWIALGYVEGRSEKQSLEDAGEEYVLTLMNRGFFQNVERDEEWCRTTFKMHDLIYDLAVQVAGSKHKMVGSCENGANDESDGRVIIHVSCNADELDDWPPSLLKIKRQLRSLLIFRINYYADFRSPKFREEISKFQCLRVLRLEGLGLKEVPASIGKLVHLRHLDLSENWFKKLPSSITQLVNLLSLILVGRLPLRELPKDMGKLVKLRHLLLPEVTLRMPSGIGNLTDLHTLNRFVAGRRESNSKQVAGLDGLNRLNNLRGRLAILVLLPYFKNGWTMDQLMSHSKSANLLGKDKLTSLSIGFEVSTGGGISREENTILLEGLQPHPNLRYLDISFYYGEKLPSWMTSGCVPNLEEIRLSGCANCRYVGSFGWLPRLKVLRLMWMLEVEYIEKRMSSIVANPNSSNPPTTTAAAANPLFPSLEQLSLDAMPKMKGWREIVCTSGSSSSWEEEDEEYSTQPLQMFQCCYYHSAFPSLKILIISDVGIEVLPEEFRGCSSLEELLIFGCEELKEIPTWIDSLISLRKLRIYYCPKLTSLPKQISKLSNLESLEIRGCPNLVERCRQPSGEDWPLIQHVPRVYLEDEY